MPRKSKEPIQPETAITPVTAQGAVRQMDALGHDPMLELIRRARGEGDCVYGRVEEAVALLRQVAQKLRPHYPKDAKTLDDLAAKIYADLAGIPTGAQRDRINLALVEYQHAALKSVEPPKVVEGQDVDCITVEWNVPKN